MGGRSVETYEFHPDIPSCTKRLPRLGHAEEELRGAYTSLYNGIHVAWGVAPLVWAKISSFGKIPKCWNFYPGT